LIQTIVVRVEIFAQGVVMREYAHVPQETLIVVIFVQTFKLIETTAAIAEINAQMAQVVILEYAHAQVRR
jgi:hypothetical protein